MPQAVPGLDYTLPGTASPWANAPGRGFTPLVTGQGQFQTVWPISGDLTTMFGQWLGGQVGAGATPFSAGTFLPSGGQTATGQLSADPIAQLQQMLDFYSGGPAGTPGQQTLLDASQSGLVTQFAETGMPINQMPAWEQMIQAQQRNIERGGADVREQFAFGGTLAGTPFANAMVDYYSQAGLQQNALLGQMTTEALEAARGRQFGAQEYGAQRRFQASDIMNQTLFGLGQIFQGMDQAAIDRTLNEFIRIQPEYAPLLQYILSLATTFPPTVQRRRGLGSEALLATIGAAGDVASAYVGAPQP